MLRKLCLSFLFVLKVESINKPEVQNVKVCLCVKELQELLEAREQECVRLRRELKEIKNTVSLRRLLTQGEISSGHRTEARHVTAHFCVLT